MSEQPALKPAAELAAKVSRPYPNDNAEYRKARQALLIEEIELRRHIARVAAQPRRLPLGGEARGYEFSRLVVLAPLVIIIFCFHVMITKDYWWGVLNLALLLALTWHFRRRLEPLWSYTRAED